MLDFDFSQRLHLAEDDFLSALESGSTMLASYCQTWSALADVLHTASRTGSVDHETLSLTRSVASRIEILTSCFLGVMRVEESNTTLLKSDCDTMLLRMATLDLGAEPQSCLQDNRDGARHLYSYYNIPVRNERSSSPFLATAHLWLLNNLYNPYPSAEVKAQMAAASSCQMSSINSWFTNARRRIGWTALCRERFSNCRADIIDAAYRALVEEDAQRPLSPDLRHAFAAIKVAVEDLFSSTLTRSTLIRDLDATTRNTFGEDGQSVWIERRTAANESGSAKVAKDPYPSPATSTTPSPVPVLPDSFTDESDEEDMVHVVAGSKRRWSSIDTGPVNEPSSTTGRLIKRLRTSSPLPRSLPSPPSSPDGTDIPSVDSSLELPLEYLPPAKTTRNSDAKTIARLQFPNDLPASPVSNSAPQPHIETEISIDDWYNTNFNALFDIPAPVIAAEPDYSATWEVKLFKDYSLPGDMKHVPKCSPAHTLETSVPVPADLSELDSLLQSICNDSVIPPSDGCTSSDVIVDHYAVSFGSSLPDCSKTNLDWMLLLGDTQAYQPTIHPTLLQCPANSQPLPEIDLSMLQLPDFIPVVTPQNDFASKQAKLHQLHTMQDAVRRMELELRSEGVII